jgi:hypothetical protein
MRVSLAISTLVLAGGLMIPLYQAAAVNITIPQLAGSWRASLIWSGSGCGPTSGLLDFTLDQEGRANSAILVMHGTCGDSTLAVPLMIQSLDLNGSGTASLSCGPGCGWDLTIQVASTLNIFNLVDVDPNNPGNYLEGTAIRQSGPPRL